MVFPIVSRHLTWRRPAGRPRTTWIHHITSQSDSMVCPLRTLAMWLQIDPHSEQ